MKANFSLRALLPFPLLALALMNGSPASARLIVGSDSGGAPQVRVFGELKRFGQQIPLLDFNAFDPQFAGGVRVAQGDVNGDGVPDVVVGSGPGGGPVVTVFDGSNTNILLSFFAYAPGVTGGVFVAAGDVTGDGVPEIITGVGNGPAHVKVFNSSDGSELRSFFAFPLSFSGGVTVAAGDLNGDGQSEIIVGAGPGGGPNVKVFDGRTGNESLSFFAYAPTFTGGVFMAAGDVDGDGRADLITGAGPGGGPHVKVFDGLSGAVKSSFFAFDVGFQGGVRVATGDVNGDGVAELITTLGPGGEPQVIAFDGRYGTTLANFFAFPSGVTNGLFVASEPPPLPKIFLEIQPLAGGNVKLEWTETNAPPGRVPNYTVLTKTNLFEPDWRSFLITQERSAEIPSGVVSYQAFKIMVNYNDTSGGGSGL